MRRYFDLNVVIRKLYLFDLHFAVLKLQPVEIGKISEQRMDNKRIKELEEKIAELKKRWPAHSVPPSMLQELDDLEDALAEELKKDEAEDSNA